MVQFIARVELHGISHDEKKYQDVHDAMKSAGFIRQIEGASGKLYHLPPAEYTTIAEIALTNAFDLARKAANKITIKSAVLVSQIE
jgi:hypothetical protein